MHWRCNLCFLINDLPQHFTYDAETQQGITPQSRPELSHNIVEYIAPSDYMVRAPQAPVFVFVVDVSFAAVKCGMLDTFAKTLQNALDSIPDEECRTRVALITFDSALHFYNLDVRKRKEVLLIAIVDQFDRAANACSVRLG